MEESQHVDIANPFKKYLNIPYGMVDNFKVSEYCS
jgi:hypothetical protein